MWRDESGPSFGDLLDTLNPLQHLPIISSLYRAVTGDQIGHIPRVIGDTLFGGPIGMLVAGIHGMVKEASGAEPVEHLVAMVRDLGGPSETAVAVANPPETGREPAKAMAASANSTSETPSSQAPGPAPAHGIALFSAMAFTRKPDRLQSAGAPSQTIRADADLERRRIASAVLEAQQAQSKLLFKSVGLPEPADRPAQESSPVAAASRTEAGAPASPDWFAQAMERGLEKYAAAKRVENSLSPKPSLDMVE